MDAAVGRAHDGVLNQALEEVADAVTSQRALERRLADSRLAQDAAVEAWRAGQAALHRRGDGLHDRPGRRGSDAGHATCMRVSALECSRLHPRPRRWCAPSAAAGARPASGRVQGGPDRRCRKNAIGLVAMVGDDHAVAAALPARRARRHGRRARPAGRSAICGPVRWRATSRWRRRRADRDRAAGSAFAPGRRCWDGPRARPG